MSDGKNNKRKRGRRKKTVIPQAQARPLYTPLDDPARSYMPPAPPSRDYEPDPISGEEVHNPLTAIAHPKTGQPVNIETILGMFRDQEEPSQDQDIAYIGSGAFAVVQTRKQGSRAVVEIVKKLPYENTNERQPWRRELSPGISRDYIPEPEPLDSLYTQDEIRSFPKLGAAVLLPLKHS